MVKPMASAAPVKLLRDAEMRALVRHYCSTAVKGWRRRQHAERTRCAGESPTDREGKRARKAEEIDSLHVQLEYCSRRRLVIAAVRRRPVAVAVQPLLFFRRRSVSPTRLATALLIRRPIEACVLRATPKGEPTKTVDSQGEQRANERKGHTDRRGERPA